MSEGIDIIKIACLINVLVNLSHTPHCFEGVRIMFVNRPWALPVVQSSIITWLCGFSRGMASIIGIDTNIEVIVVSLTTWEADHSPRATPEGFGELPRSLMRQQWPKLMYQCLFYHDETKLMMNKQILSQNCPCVQHGYICTSRGHVTWLFLICYTCSNHCDVTARFVSLNSNCTLNQNTQQNSHYHSWETDQNLSKCFHKMIFWKYKWFTMDKLPHPKHTSVLLDICHPHTDSHLLSKAFSKLSLNSTMEPFK